MQTEYNQTNTLKSNTPTRDADIKTNKTGQAQTLQQRTSRVRKTWGTMQAILACNSQQSNCYSQCKKDQLDIVLFFNYP